MITNYKVFEQAFSKKKFEDKATDLSIQINEHFFKLIYCHYYNKENGNIKHWKSEIIGWFSWFIKTNLKTNTKKSKLLWYNLIHGFDYENLNIMKMNGTGVSDILIMNISHLLKRFMISI